MHHNPRPHVLDFGFSCCCPALSYVELCIIHARGRPPSQRGTIAANTVTGRELSVYAMSHCLCYPSTNQASSLSFSLSSFSRLSLDSAFVMACRSPPLTPSHPTKFPRTHPLRSAFLAQSPPSPRFWLDHLAAHILPSPSLVAW